MGEQEKMQWRYSRKRYTWRGKKRANGQGECDKIAEIVGRSRTVEREACSKVRNVKICPRTFYKKAGSGNHHTNPNRQYDNPTISTSKIPRRHFRQKATGQVPYSACHEKGIEVFACDVTDCEKHFRYHISGNSKTL